MSFIHTFLIGLTLITACGLFWNFILPLGGRADSWCDKTVLTNKGNQSIDLPVNAALIDNTANWYVNQLEGACRSDKDFYIVAVGFHKSGTYHLHWATFTLAHRASDGGAELPNANDLHRIAKRIFKGQGLTGFYSVVARETATNQSAVLC